MRLSRRSAPPRARVLLLAPRNSYRIAAYQSAAATVGLDLLVASEGKHSLAPGCAGGLQVDFRSPRETVARVRAAARTRPFHGVVATDDSTVELACEVAENLGLPHNPLSAARLSRRKDLAREALRRAGLPTPRYRLLDTARETAVQCDGVGFPCVVKPLAMSGSRGVIRADDIGELVAAVARLRGILEQASCTGDEGRYVLVEDFLAGPEVAVEGLLHDGRLHIIAIFDKPDPLNGPYFEETYYITPSRLPADVRDLIAGRLREAIAAYGLRQGPVHAELRVSNGDAWVIELAARTIGGNCARLIGLGTEPSLEELVLMHAIGRRLAPLPVQEAAGVLMLPTPRAGMLRRVEGVLAARKVPLVDEVEIAVRAGYELVPLPEGSSYLGFVFARGPTPSRVEAALREADACLRVVTAPFWRVAPA